MSILYLLTHSLQHVYDKDTIITSIFIDEDRGITMLKIKNKLCHSPTESK